MNVPEIFMRDVMYIEPIFDEEYMCQAVSESIVTPYKKTSTDWLDEYLIYFYSTNLNAIRAHVKINFNIHRMIPICIDVEHRFILFPLNSNKNKNNYYVNLAKVYRFYKQDKKTVIEFICGDTLIVDIPIDRCEKQYSKAALIYDKSLKFKQFRERYLNCQTEKTVYNIKTYT